MNQKKKKKIDGDIVAGENGLTHLLYEVVQDLGADLSEEALLVG
jgi:hypothetical protein